MNGGMTRIGAKKFSRMHLMKCLMLKMCAPKYSNKTPLNVQQMCRSKTDESLFVKLKGLLSFVQVAR